MEDEERPPWYGAPPPIAQEIAKGIGPKDVGPPPVEAEAEKIVERMEEIRKDILDHETVNITSPAKQGRVKYSILILFLCGVLSSIGNLLYTNKVNSDADHQWCEVLNISVSAAARTSPPPTADQIRGRELLRKLARDKGCG